MRSEQHSESWKKMVLRSMPAPAWLALDAPDGDIVVSSRVRYARNVCGYRFPHWASPDDLRAVQNLVRSGLSGLKLEAINHLTEAERDFLLGCRLISPDFAHRDPGRSLILDKSRTLSVMINEEDHVRIQALTPGWSIKSAQKSAESVLSLLSSRVPLMQSEQYGFLTASPYNAGEARRRSALFHLIGLGHTKRLPAVLQALAAWRLTARGLFGESSRAVGAFFQVSAISGGLPEFIGACDYLAHEERMARREVTRATLQERTRAAIDFAIGASELSLADALRVLAWVRWAATAGVVSLEKGYRDVDQWVSTMEVHCTQDPKTASRHRAVFVRNRVEAL